MNSHPIPRSQLETALAKYDVIEQQDIFMKRSTGELVYIDYHDIIPTFLFVLVQEFGLHSRYYIDLGEEDDSEVDVDDEDLASQDSSTSLLSFIPIEVLEKMADQFEEYNVYFDVNAHAIASVTSRLLILSSDHFSKKETFDTTIRTIYNTIEPGSADAYTSIAEISPAYIYVKDLSTFTEHHELVQIAYGYGCTSNILFSLPPLKEEESAMTIDRILEEYSSVITEDNYYILGDDDPAIQPLLSKATVVSFNQIKTLYQRLCDTPEEYIILNSDCTSPILVMVSVLAFINAGKKPIFIYNTRNYDFIRIYLRILYRKDFPLMEQIDAISQIPGVGETGVEFINNWLRVFQIESQKPVLSYKVLDAKVVASFIQELQQFDAKQTVNRFTPYYEILLASGIRPTDIHSYDQTEVNYFQVVNTNDGPAKRWSLVSLDTFIADTWGVYPKLPLGAKSNSEDMNRWEDIAYSILRVLEQIIENYKEIHHVGDLIILHEDYSESGEKLEEGRTFIGFGKLDISYTGKVIQYGIVNQVISDVHTGDNILPLQILYDYKTRPFLLQVVDSFKAAKLPLPKLKTSPIVPLTSRQTDMLIYSCLGDQYHPNPFLWALMPTNNASVTDYMFIDSHATFLRKQWFSHVTEQFTSYGFRLLPCRAAPLTIFGTPNYSNKNLASNSRVNVFWEVFKHLPRKKGD